MGVYSCSPGGGPSAAQGHEWTTIEVVRPANATSATVELTWQAVNPTMTSLEIGLLSAGETLSPEVVLGPGTSPWRVQIGPDVLDRFGSRFVLGVYAGRDCATSPGAGAHAAPSGLGDAQEFSGSLTWNPW